MSVEIDLLLITREESFVSPLELYSDWATILVLKIFLISERILQFEQLKSPELHTPATGNKTNPG